MKKRVAQLITIAVLSVLLGLGFSQFKPDTAQAALGNHGLPVYCYTSSGGISAGTTLFLSCYPPTPPAFDSGQRVPSGYYFLVTDIFVTPMSGANGNTPVSFYLFDAYGTNGRSRGTLFRSVDGASYGQHFNMPLYVLPAGHRLEVQAFNANATAFDIKVTGILVDNVNYLPAVIN